MKHQRFVYREFAQVPAVEDGNRGDVKQAYERGVRDGSKLVKDQLDGMANDIRDQVGALMRAFEEQQRHFYVEAESRLAAAALTIAKKVLCREAQADPLLLQAAVRKAIEQVRKAESIRVFVPSQHLQLWRDALDMTVEVVGDPLLSTGEARISCELGTADLGVSAQLLQLERAVLQKPAASMNLQ